MVNRLASKGVKYYRLTTKREKNYRLPTEKKNQPTTEVPTLTAIIDICFQKEEIGRAFCIFSSLRSNHIKGNYRISCHLLTFWPEECGIILQNNFRYSSPRNLPLLYFNHVSSNATVAGFRSTKKNTQDSNLKNF